MNFSPQDKTDPHTRQGARTTTAIDPREPFAILPISLARSTNIAVRLAIVLASRADKKTGRCFPHRETLANDLGVSISTVDLGIKELTRVGYLKVDKRSNGARRPVSNIYTIWTRHHDRKISVGENTPRPKNQSSPQLKNQSHRSKGLNQIQLNQRNTPPTPAIAADAAGSGDDLTFDAEDLRGLFNETLTAKTFNAPLPQCSELTPKLQRAIALRLRKHPDRAWWADLFAASASSRLVDGSMDFRPGLDWFIDQDNARKVTDGNYQRRPQRTSTPETARAPLAFARTAAERDDLEARRTADAERAAAAERLKREAQDALNALPIEVRQTLVTTAADELLNEYPELSWTNEKLTSDSTRRVVDRILNQARGRSITVALAVEEICSQIGQQSRRQTA